MSESILQKDRECYFCGAQGALDRHHTIGGPYRKRAEEDGLWVYLCRQCHDRTHFDPSWSRPNMLLLRRESQRAWMERYQQDTAAWIRVYGKSYLSE